MSVCGIARRGDDAAILAAEHKPSVVLMDFSLPDLSGPTVATNIRCAAPGAAIVFHSADDSEDALLDAIDVGVIGYLTKSASAEQIIEAIRKAAVGEVLIPVDLFAKAIARQRVARVKQDARDKVLSEFTPRELDVLRLLAEGHDTAIIAFRLGIAVHTVDWHLRHVIEKLQVHSKLQAVVAAARMGLVEL